MSPASASAAIGTVGLLPDAELWDLLQVAVCVIDRQLFSDEVGVAGVSLGSKACPKRGEFESPTPSKNDAS